MQALDVSRDASIIVVCGSSGSGKSAWVKKRIAKKRRVLVWDTDDEYAGDFERVSTCSGLVDRIKGAASARVAFVAGREHFDFWARVAFTWGNCTAVAEELAGVTSPGKAPTGWHTLVSRGRKRGVEVIGVTQRPSESDKTIMGNASLFHCAMLSREQDRAYMAKELDVSRDMISGLEKLEFLEKKAGIKGVTRGKLRF